MTRNRLGVLISAILVAIVFTSMVRGSYRSNTRIDEFLARRNAVLTRLAGHEAALPFGVSTTMPQIRSTVDPLFPGDEHIRSVVRSTAWRSRASKSALLDLSAEFLEGRTAIDVARDLVRHFVAGLDRDGLTPMPSDQPGIASQKDYAVASQIWFDSRQELVVIVQADCGANSKKAHVACYVIERFEP